MYFLPTWPDNYCSISMFEQFIVRPNNQRNVKKTLWYVSCWQKKIRHAQTQTQTLTIYRWWQTQIHKHCLFHILFILQIHWWWRMQITWLEKNLSLSLTKAQLFLFLIVLFITPSIPIFLNLLPFLFVSIHLPTKHRWQLKGTST